METFYDVLSDIYTIVLDHVSHDVVLSIIGSVIGYLIRRLLPTVFGDFLPEPKPENIPPASHLPSSSGSVLPDLSREPTTSRDSTMSNRHDKARHRSSRQRGGKIIDTPSFDGGNTKPNEHPNASDGYDNTGIDDDVYSNRESFGDTVSIDNGVSMATDKENRDGYNGRFETAAADVPFVYRVLKESIQNGGVLKHLIDYIIMLRKQNDQYQRELRYWQQQYAELSAHYQEVIRKRHL